MFTIPRTPTTWTLSLVLLINRLLLGGLFALAGYGKIMAGVGKFYEGSFSKLKPEWLPDPVAMAYGYALPFVELIAGALLAIGLFTRLSALVVALMLGSFLIAFAQIHGITAQGPDAGGAFSKNYILLGLALVIMLLGSGRLGVDNFIPARKKKPAKD